MVSELINFTVAGNYTLSDSNTTEIDNGLFKKKKLGPDNIANKLLWLRGDDAVFDGGNNLTSWADRSDQGNDVDTINGSPGLGTAINGQQTVEFSKNTTTESIQWTSDFIGTNDVTEIVVYNLDTLGGSNNGRLFDNGKLLTLFGAGDIFRHSNNGGSNIATSLAFTRNVDHYVEIYTNATSNFKIDGVDRTNATNAGSKTTGTVPLRFGNSSGNNRNFDGDVAEIIVINGQLSAGDRTILEGYFKDRYNIGPGTIQYPTDQPSVILNTDLTSIVSTFTNIEETTGSGSVGDYKYIYEKDDSDLYYNSGWVSSNGTSAQSNTVAEILANIGTMPVPSTDWNFKIFSPSDNDYSSLDQVEITFTSNVTPPTIDSPETVNTVDGADVILKWIDPSAVDFAYAEVDFNLNGAGFGTSALLEDNTLSSAGTYMKFNNGNTSYVPLDSYTLRSSLSNLQVNDTFQARIRATDTNDNTSGWKNGTEITIENQTILNLFDNDIILTLEEDEFTLFIE